MTSKAEELAARLRRLALGIRSNSSPLADLIPVIQQAADELSRLDKLLADTESDHTHQCQQCRFQYTPQEGANEDCPVCGCNGVAPPAAEGPPA